MQVDKKHAKSEHYFNYSVSDSASANINMKKKLLSAERQ